MSRDKYILLIALTLAGLGAWRSANAASCVMNAPTCTLVSGSPRVVVTWGPLAACGGNAMERSATPWNPNATWDPLTHRKAFFPSQCGSVWCGPRGMGAATSFTDTNVVANDASPYAYSYRIKVNPAISSNTVNFAVSTCACGGPCPPADDSQYVTMTAPGTVQTNAVFAVTITMRNTGTATWTSPAGYAFATTAGNATLWKSVSSIPVAGSIAHNGTTTFAFTATAPAVAGTYQLGSWQMKHSGTAFGQSSPSTPIIVTVVDQPAAGSIESATCGGLTGWAKDPDAIAPTSVRIYRDGPAGTGALETTISANGTHAAPYTGHGWSWAPPTDGASHRWYIYTQDTETALWYALSGSPSGPLSCVPGPTVTLTKVDQPDYCSTGPEGIATWQYTSSGGLAQSAWQLQAARDQTFTTIVYDSGKSVGTTTTAGTGQGVLAYGNTYWMRVKAWDSADSISQWSTPLSFTTPPGAYPNASFVISPSAPTAGQTVTFTDTSDYRGAMPVTREWDFGDGTMITESPGTGTTTHAYASSSAGITAMLSVTSTNSAGQSCSATATFGGANTVPIYKEVLPGTIRSPSPSPQP